jgi:hypothetical protein
MELPPGFALVRLLYGSNLNEGTLTNLQEFAAGQAPTEYIALY